MHTITFEGAPKRCSVVGASFWDQGSVPEDKLQHRRFLVSKTRASNRILNILSLACVTRVLHNGQICTSIHIWSPKLRNSNTILNMLSTRHGPKDKLQRHPEHHEPKGAPKFAAPHTNFGFITCWVHLVVIVLIGGFPGRKRSLQNLTLV